MRISDWSSDVCSSDLRNLWTFGLTSGQHVENDRIRVGFAHSANDRTGLAVAVTASLEDLASAGEDHGFQVNRGRRIGAPSVRKGIVYLFFCCPVAVRSLSGYLSASLSGLLFFMLIDRKSTRLNSSH